MKHLRVSEKHIHELGTLQSNQTYSREQIIGQLKAHLPNLPESVLTKMIEAAAIAAYHQGIGFPVVSVIVVDDAPQFRLLTKELALCWIHDGRHYKKLMPVIADHQKALADFLTSYWNYYHRLQDYKKAPSEALAYQLTQDFDALFSTHTGYAALDERILKTKAKKEHLLLVLKYPELPLHNNASELAARSQVRKRDVSLHAITQEGTEANDTFLSIVETCKKLGISAYEFIFDRIKQSSNIPPLAQLIREKIKLYPWVPSGP